jgi:hypothetical protein
MMNTTNQVEHRKSSRFDIREGTFIAVKSGDAIVGPIRNLSRGGLSFKYIDKKDQLKGWLEIDIFTRGMDFYLKGVPSLFVWNSKLFKNDPLSTITLRHCGIRFGELAPSQTTQIENFLKKYADRRTGKDRRHPDASPHKGPDRRIEFERRKGLVWS